MLWASACAPPAPPSPCKCKGRFIHPHFHLKLIEPHAPALSVPPSTTTSVKVSTIKRPPRQLAFIHLYLLSRLLSFARPAARVESPASEYATPRLSLAPSAPCLTGSATTGQPKAPGRGGQGGAVDESA